MARQSQIETDAYSGAERAMQSAIARNPETYKYSYEGLNEKYPVAATRPIAPAWIQEDIDEQELERKTAEIAYKEKQYRMQLMDSQLNRENARLTQAPLIRKELSSLNPQSDDFQERLIDIYQRNPIGYEDEALQKYVIQPLTNTHNQYIQNKNYMERLSQRPMSPSEMEKGNDLLMELNDMKIAGEPLSPAQEEMRLNLESRMSGYGSITQPSTQPQQQLNQNASGNNFLSIEEAEASGLPTGTIVYINGRKARID